MRKFHELTDEEIIALAIANEEEDARIYLNFARKLKPNYPSSAKIFEEMALEEQGHRHRLLELFNSRYGNELPYITRQDVKGFIKRNPIWLLPDLRLEDIRKQAEVMEYEASRFYSKAAERTTDLNTRKLLADLAEVEKKHESLAAQLGEQYLTPDIKSEEDATARRIFLLQVVQPGLAGLIDGSVSTLAPIFAAAFATHNPGIHFLLD